ncbi:MAG: hypothetical protein ACI9UU_002176 [Candidatus Azotimanducaceae bacterium]|jgi:hypothetical protein
MTMKATSYGSTQSQNESEILSHDSQSQPGKLVKFLQRVGALVVTIAALWFLFGIPAYLLFGTFFE